MGSDWPSVELRQVVQIDLDKVQVDPAATYDMVGVLSFGKGLFHREPVSGNNTSYKYFYRLKEDHVVMSQLFGWEGALALSASEFAGKFLSPQFPTFVCDQRVLDRRYLGWFIRRPVFWNELGKRAKGMGDRRRTLNPESLLSCTIPLPHLEEQRRIVAKIDELAAKIEEAKNLKVEIDRTFRQLLQSAFAKITRSSKFMKMSEVAPITRRPIDVDVTSEYPELGIRSFGNGTFHKPALNGMVVGNKKMFQIEPGNLVFNNVFAWEGAVAVAKAEDSGRFGSHRFITCLPKKELVTSEFLCFYFLTAEGLERLGQASPGGAGRNRTLGLEALSKIEVPVPQIENQNWFDLLQTIVESLKNHQRQTIAELDALLPSILDKAFKGEL
jgi:type I restriction enzyme S subunit